MLALILGSLAAVGDKEEKSVSGDGPVTVSLALWNVLKPGDNERALRVEQKIVEDFGIEFVIRPIVFNDYTEKLRLMMASDDLPDIFIPKRSERRIGGNQLVGSISERVPGSWGKLRSPFYIPPQSTANTAAEYCEYRRRVLRIPPQSTANTAAEYCSYP
jgi:hypothetical protein